MLRFALSLTWTVTAVVPLTLGAACAPIKPFGIPKSDGLAPVKTVAFNVNPWLQENNDIDSDGDGLSDFDETHKYFTDPHRQDTDGDGILDGDWSERREY